MNGGFSKTHDPRLAVSNRECLRLIAGNRLRRMRELVLNGLTCVQLLVRTLFFFSLSKLSIPATVSRRSASSFTAPHSSWWLKLNFLEIQKLHSRFVAKLRYTVYNFPSSRHQGLSRVDAAKLWRKTINREALVMQNLSTMQSNIADGGSQAVQH